MARRYVRDNRGRFASVGATARGGRLRTAAGNKRATETKEIAGGKPAAAIKGKVKRDPAAMAKASKPAASKAERVLGRLTANAKRAAGGSDAKSARSSAVALMAQHSLSNRAVGKRDPNQQYPRAELVAGLNKSMSKPLPKAQKKSTGKKPTKGELRLERDAAASLIRFNRRRKP